MKLENGEKYPCTICENTGKNVDCLNCIFGEFMYEDTCYTHECAYHCEDSCIINAYERCRAWNTNESK